MNTFCSIQSVIATNRGASFCRCLLRGRTRLSIPRTTLPGAVGRTGRTEAEGLPMCARSTEDGPEEESGCSSDVP